MADRHADPRARAAPSRLGAGGAAGWVGYAVAIVALAWAFDGSGWSLARLGEAPASLADVFARAWPPSTDRLPRLTERLIETIQIAVAAAAATGVVLSIPVAMRAARGLIAGPTANAAVRTVAGVARSVPDIAWALVVVIAVGLGRFAGALAIAMDTPGFCGRFFADDVEAVDQGPGEALRAGGAGKLDVAACAVVPDAAPAFVSTSLCALERAVRSLTILGLVGVGGVGIELKVAFDLFDYPTATAIILMIAVAVIAVERLGGLVRARILGTGL